MKKKATKFVAVCAKKITAMSANQACYCLTYQDKLPVSAKKLRKF